jgi:hypothetical protein
MSVRNSLSRFLRTSAHRGGNPASGEVGFAGKPKSWQAFSDLMKTIHVSRDLFADRQGAAPQKRKHF